ncbi:MAG TPA: YIP1 family protein [Pyrinomonadaceae bacterium]|nr:YIP1 family protein [Pyrinomonadaceae bacterium]
MSQPNENFQPPPSPPLAEPAPRAPRPTKLRPVAIAAFVVGLIVLVLSIAKVVPGGPAPGGVLAFMGIVLFALSFIPLPVTPDAEAPMSALQKLSGVFFEPSNVFRNLRAHPRWVAPYVLITLLAVVYTNAFTQRLTAERIVNFRVDKVAELPAPFTPKPERIEAMRTEGIEQLKSPVQRVFGVVSMASAIFFFTALIAALYMLAILAFGGRMNFWQAVAVMFYSAVPVSVIQKVLSLLILYVKSPDDIHPILNAENLVQDNLGILIAPANHPVLFVIASSIGLLSFYGLWLKATGLRNGGTKVSKGVAWGVAVTLWILGLLLASGMTALFPQFIQ